MMAVLSGVEGPRVGISQALWGDRRMGVYGWRAVKDRGQEDPLTLARGRCRAWQTQWVSVLLSIWVNCLSETRSL